MNVMDISRVVDEIRDELLSKYKPERIVLFGSASEGHGEVDDIDLFIVKRDVPYYGADRIIELTKLIDASVAVDYIVLKPEEVENRLSMGDPFITKIIREGKVLYG